MRDASDQVVGNSVLSVDDTGLHVMVSPEASWRMNDEELRAIAREVAAAVVEETGGDGERAQVVVGVHRNTATPHVHIAISHAGDARDITDEMRSRAQRAAEVATQRLSGGRTAADRERSERMEIEALGARTMTRRLHDRAVANSARDPHGRSTLDMATLSANERARVAYLERLGLASIERTAAGGERAALHPQLMPALQHLAAVDRLMRVKSVGSEKSWSRSREGPAHNGGSDKVGNRPEGLSVDQAQREVLREHGEMRTTADARSRQKERSRESMGISL